MADSGITLFRIANLALQVAISQGFNAVRVARRWSIESSDDALGFVFGDARSLRGHTSPALEYATAYDESATCMRESRIIERHFEDIAEIDLPELALWLGDQLMELKADA